MFASYYANTEAVEFLAASDASAHIIDKKGRSCLHYAAINDNAQLIETIFLHAKANPNPIQAATNIIDSTALIVEESSLGTLDERFSDMER